EELSPKAPLLLLIGAQADCNAEGERARALGVVRELDRAARDRHAVMTEGRVREMALAGDEQRPEIAAQARRRGRAPQVVLRADLRVQSGARRPQSWIELLRGRGVTAVRLWVGGRHQRHHLRVEQFLQ